MFVLGVEFMLERPIRVVDPGVIESVRSERCEYCGKPGPVDVHHIKPRSAGRRDIRPNLISLCRECHRKAQAHEIDRLELVQLVAKREGMTPEEVCVAIEIPVPDTFPPLKTPDARECSLDELLQAYADAEKAEQTCRWAKGEIIEMMRSMGLSYRKIASLVGCSESTVRKYAKTYRAFPDENLRVPELSFEHHWAAANSSDPAKWIARAADEHLSTRQLRKAILEEEASSEVKAAAGAEEEKEVREARKVAERVEKIIARGGPGAELLREKLRELLGV
ncbi:HNH endonuclease [Desulfofundulus kuznetsovii DSM 6115]|uniref:HNH endonuclease n=2 Tax=Desulfofundulus kuznetsovii TaxID=58135 RepID=A0AAU8P976_DESK7|nr:HNH endonuclease [Desulfofundulus kuznetsovii DSM 6115]